MEQTFLFGASCSEILLTGPCIHFLCMNPLFADLVKCPNLLICMCLTLAFELQGSQILLSSDIIF